jgi:rubrerythrin
MDKNEYKAEQVQDSMLSLKSFTGYSYSLLRYSNSGDSLDESFAKNNNLWICRYCETINSKRHDECVACGKSNDDFLDD